ncbi:MAG TPA: tagaturonate reductase [Gemmatimonadaceae bacterium]|nr:tagaturonate reductase [Gemmatimonadaceae bacterium]
MTPPRPTLNAALARTPAFAARRDLLVPPLALLDLPERVVQFGTGAFLRGFVDFFVDEANRRGAFAGRVVAVGSTGSGRDARLNEQDGLYTLVARGVAGGERQEERRVVASVSRALSARDDWGAVLALARSPELRLVVSNTTEVGIALDERDRHDDAPPHSFPGKLARFLAERGSAVGHDETKGVVVLPCELIEGNGEQLREIVLAHVRRWGRGAALERWIARAVPFCNTLVDRIVPGAPAGADARALGASLGYDDAMLTTAETYRLFAIERPRDARGVAMLDALGLAAADAGVVVTDDVAPYRERKVRLLNGTHTIMVPLALLHGCLTVRDALAHETVGRFVRRVLLEEIVPATDAPGAERFARDVLDRFANPAIHHALADITLQQTTKMRVRMVPSIVRHGERTGRAPASIAFGFAAYLLFVRGAAPARPDDEAERVRAHWRAAGDDAARVAAEVCADAALWPAALASVPGFATAVGEALERMMRDGVPAALEAHLAEAPV